MGFPGSSVVKNLPAKQEKRVWSLGQEDPLEKEMVTLQYACLDNSKKTKKKKNPLQMNETALQQMVRDTYRVVTIQKQNNKI